jgi:hypothetical protein
LRAQEEDSIELMNWNTQLGRYDYNMYISYHLIKVKQPNISSLTRMTNCNFISKGVGNKKIMFLLTAKILLEKIQQIIPLAGSLPRRLHLFSKLIKRSCFQAPDGVQTTEVIESTA